MMEVVKHAQLFYQPVQVQLKVAHLPLKEIPRLPAFLAQQDLTEIQMVDVLLVALIAMFVQQKHLLQQGLIVILAIQTP